MKQRKKTRKGFTLIELLLALIVLAIIVYVAFIIVMNITTKAKVKAFQVTLDNIESWVTQQYEMALYTGSVMSADNSVAFSSVCGTSGENCFYSNNDETKRGVVLNMNESTESNINVTNSRNFITASGSKPGNYTTVIIAIDEESEKSCIKASISTTGEFYYDGIIEDKLNYYQSSSCKMDVFDGIEMPTISY